MPRHIYQKSVMDCAKENSKVVIIKNYSVKLKYYVSRMIFEKDRSSHL
ncbi:hypothetical protein J9303_17900 [Bacillaceae bacterium Marseille-Q3522]|nr:hypothetical protein [Bacillaceae bacterium Marseille-Q3522]